MGIFDRMRGHHVRVHVIIHGRIGDDWKDVDEHLRVPLGTTLAQLVELAEQSGIPLREALASSPHLTDTMMVNGERCPLAENGVRVLADDDQIYLLAPLAGG